MLGDIERVTVPGRANAPTATPARRRDIDGLRAVAVLLVVLNHVFYFPGGGFVGVDVFFVISGFLITGLLVREHTRTGRISIQDFYVRRAKRILPAAIVVLVATVVTAFIVWYPPRALQTLFDAVAALFFASNWHAVRLGTDYLQADAPPSPVQHYWSLSVEEQFYIVWPVLMIATLAIIARRRMDQARVLAIVTGAVAVVSFAWAVIVTTAAPQFAYFDTISRVWELAAGAVLAVVASKLRMSDRTALVLAWVGVAIIVASAAILTPATPFPGPWAILPVAGTLLVIAAGGGNRPTTRLLSNGAAQYVGRISYSLYLWHFPVIVFAHAVAPRSVVVDVVAFLLMFGLAAASYRWIEQPTNRSRLLAVSRQWRRAGQVALAATVAVVLIGASAVQLRGPEEVVSARALTETLSDTGAAPVVLDPALTSVAAVENAVRDAIDGGVQPGDVDLSVLDASAAAPEMNTEVGCRNDIASTAEPSRCVYSGGPQTVVVVGDSVALSWVPAVRIALPDWTVIAVGYASCPAIPARVGTGVSADRCDAAQEAMMAVVDEATPDLVITSSAQSSLTRMDVASDDLAADLWTDATREFVATSGAPTVVLANPPAGTHPDECLSRFTGLENCVSQIDALWERKRDAEQAAARASGGTFVDVGPWFCDTDGRCPMAIASTVLRYDGAHLTSSASASLGRALAESLPMR